MFPDRGITHRHHPHGGVTRRGVGHRRLGTVPQELGEGVTRSTPNRYALPLPQRQENRPSSNHRRPVSRYAAVRTVAHRKAPQSFAAFFQSRTVARRISPPALAQPGSSRAPRHNTRVVRFLHHSNRQVDRCYAPSRRCQSNSGGKVHDSFGAGSPSQAPEKPAAQDRPRTGTQPVRPALHPFPSP